MYNKLPVAGIMHCFAGYCMGQSVVMDIEGGKTSLDVGESVTFRCTIHEPDKLESDWRLDWYKMMDRLSAWSQITEGELYWWVDQVSPGHFTPRSTYENIDGYMLPVHRLTITGKH